MFTLTPSNLWSGWPSLNRTMAVMLVLIQALTVTLLMQPIMLPVVMIGLLGWIAPQLKLTFHAPVSLGLVLILVVGASLHHIQRKEFVSMGFIGSRVAYEVACCCIAFQLYLLFIRKFAVRLPVWYLAVSGTSMVFSGDIRVTSFHSNLMLWIVALYLILWSGFAMSCRTPVARRSRKVWGRRTAITLILFLSLIVGRWLAQTYQKNASKLEYWVTEYLYQGRISRPGSGFSGKGGLSDINEMKDREADREVLRIRANFSPDYLRGRVFTEFSRQRWIPSDNMETVIPIMGHPPLRQTYPNESVYQLTRSWPVSPVTMSVLPINTATSAHFFLPLGAAVLSCDGLSVRMDANGIVERDSKSQFDSYQVLVSTPPPIPPEEIDPRFLAIPDRLPEITNQVADEIFADTSSTAEKIRAVETYFHRNYSYSTRLRVPRGVNRLEYFLTYKPGAHCEYFATATTLLLRLANVPARYVTGYVVSGKNPLDGMYYSLPRDAHAWVEAYDAEQQRWVIVESTPSDGVPLHSQLNSLSSLKNAAWGGGLQLLEFLQSGFIREAILRYWKISMLTIVVVFAGWLLSSLYLGKFMIAWSREPKTPTLFVPLARERERMDRFLSERGLLRPPEESLLHFADRLESHNRLTTSSLLAGWYRKYVQLRFQDRPLEPGAVSKIREQRQQLVRTTKVVP